MAKIIRGFSAPVGFDEKEPVRLRIMRVIAARLAEIDQANQYRYTFASVFYGQSLKAEPEIPPQIYVWDQEETSETQTMGGKEYKSLIVEVEALAIVEDATLIAETNNLMLADVHRAMFEDALTGTIDPECLGLADGMSYAESRGMFGVTNHLWAGNVSQWVINYHSIRGKPHLLQEED
jgi:hypothetical protein